MDEMRSDSVPEGIDVVSLIRTHGRRMVIVAVAMCLLVGVAGTAYLLLQSARQISTLEFRPTFEGASEGKYPNGIAFSSSDVRAPQIVDLVFDANSIEEYCSREVFRGGFFVEQRSDQSAFLDAEYVALLSDARITAVERQRLQAEYAAKRDALPVQFRLVFVKPRTCAAIPQVVVAKVMTDVLATWANESEAKRGVLNHQVQVLTPAMLDVGLGEEGSRLLRADLLRTALLRIVDNLDEVQKIEGAALVRYGTGRLTFVEVQNKVIDLVRSRLEPLVASATQTMARDALSWVTETVASAERQQQAAEGRAAANREALQLYSGMGTPAQTGRSTQAQGTLNGSTDVQTLSPSIDSTFIDRIVEMSESNTTFRQELTRSMVAAANEAVDAAERAAYYRRLVQSLRAPGAVGLSTAEIDARLDAIVEQGKALTQQFNDLSDEFSRVSLRPASAMYQTEKPVTTEVSRGFTLRELVMLVAGAFFASLFLAFGFFVIRERLTAEPSAG